MQDRGEPSFPSVRLGGAAALPAPPLPGAGRDRRHAGGRVSRDGRRPDPLPPPGIRGRPFDARGTVLAPCRPRPRSAGGGSALRPGVGCAGRYRPSRFPGLSLPQLLPSCLEPLGERRLAARGADCRSCHLARHRRPGLGQARAGTAGFRAARLGRGLREAGTPRGGVGRPGDRPLSSPARAEARGTAVSADGGVISAPPAVLSREPGSLPRPADR